MEGTRVSGSFQRKVPSRSPACPRCYSAVSSSPPHPLSVCLMRLFLHRLQSGSRDRSGTFAVVPSGSVLSEGIGRGLDGRGGAERNVDRYSSPSSCAREAGQPGCRSLRNFQRGISSFEAAASPTPSTSWSVPLYIYTTLAIRAHNPLAQHNAIDRVLPCIRPLSVPVMVACPRRAHHPPAVHLHMACCPTMRRLGCTQPQRRMACHLGP